MPYQQQPTPTSAYKLSTNILFKLTKAQQKLALITVLVLNGISILFYSADKQFVVFKSSCVEKKNVNFVFCLIIP